MKKVGKVAGISILVGSMLVIFTYAIFISITGIGAYSAKAKQLTAEAKSQNFYFSGSDLFNANILPESSEKSKKLYKALIKLKLYRDKDDSKFLDSWKKNAAVVSIIEENLDVERYFFDRGYDKLSAVEYADLTGIKDMVKAYCRLAENEIKRGNLNEGVHLLCQASKFGKLAQHEPSIIGSLVQISCDAICLESIRKTLNQHTLSTKDLQRLNDSVNKMTSQIRASAILRSECLMFMQISNSLEIVDETTENLSLGEAAKFYALKYVPKMKAAGYAYGIEAWTKAAAKVEANPTDLDTIEQAFADVQNASADKDINSFLLGLSSPVSTMWFTAFRKHLATRSVIQQALQFKIARQNRQPIQITDLPLTQDMDKKPIRKKRMSNSMLIYSVAPNGIDDGGIQPKANLGGNYDFVIKLKN